MVWAPTLSNPHLRWRCFLKMSFYSCLEGLTAPLWVLGQPLEFEEGLAAWRAVEPMLWRKWSWLGGDWDGGQYMAGEWGAITALLGLQGQEWGGGLTHRCPPFPWIPRSHCFSDAPAGHRDSGTAQFAEAASHASLSQALPSSPTRQMPSLPCPPPAPMRTQVNALAGGNREGKCEVRPWKVAGTAWAHPGNQDNVLTCEMRVG